MHDMHGAVSYACELCPVNTGAYGLNQPLYFSSKCYTTLLWLADFSHGIGDSRSPAAGGRGGASQPAVVGYC